MALFYALAYFVCIQNSLSLLLCICHFVTVIWNVGITYCRPTLSYYVSFSFSVAKYTQFIFFCDRGLSHKFGSYRDSGDKSNLLEECGESHLKIMLTEDIDIGIGIGVGCE